VGKSNQQAQVYEAQWFAEDGLGPEMRGRSFESEEELQLYVDDLRENEHWQDYDVQSIEAFCRDKPGACGGLVELGFGQIEMGPDKMYERPVLHEVAHVLAAARYDSQSHDPWFVRTYLELVYEHMGSAAYKALYDAFQVAGVQLARLPIRSGQIAL